MIDMLITVTRLTGTLTLACGFVYFDRLAANPSSSFMDCATGVKIPCPVRDLVFYTGLACYALLACLLLLESLAAFIERFEQ